MKPMRALLAPLIAGAACTAMASYELALVLQNYTPPGGPLQRYVTRWDPSSGASLGGFRVLTNATRMAVDPTAPGTVDLADYAPTGLSIRRMDYSTGLLTSIFDTTINVTTLRSFRYLPNGRMLLAGTILGAERVRVFDLAGGSYTALSLPAGTNQAIAATVGPDGTFYALTRQPGTTAASKFTVTSYTSAGTLVDTKVVVDNTAADYFDLDYSSGYVHVGYSALSNRRFATASGTTLGAFNSTGGYFVSSSTYSLGHGDTVYGFAYDVDDARMVLTGARVSSSTGNYYHYVPSTVYGPVSDSAIVLAPEPATLFALGLGALVLARRNRG